MRAGRRLVSIVKKLLAGRGVFQDWGDERLMGWAGSEPPSAPEDWRLLPPLVETGRRGLRPHAGGGPNPDTVRHYVAPILKRARGLRVLPAARSVLE